MLFGTNRNITKEDLLYEADIVKEKFNSAKRGYLYDEWY
jgi:hypothetical protein